MNEVWDMIFDENGNLVYEGYLRNGSPWGSGTSFFDNGNKYQEGLFGHKGLLYGREYYKNGSIRFEGTYAENHGYGPNYPIYGSCFDESGAKIYEGRLKVSKSDNGFPKVESPEGFGPVAQKDRPGLMSCVSHSALLPDCCYVRAGNGDERTVFIEFLDKNGFRPLCAREDAVSSRLPVKVGVKERTYEIMGNITCAAAAASSGILMSAMEFRILYENSNGLVIV